MSICVQNFSILAQTVSEILSLEKRLGGSGRAGPGRVGPGRAGPGRAGPGRAGSGRVKIEIRAYFALV